MNDLAMIYPAVVDLSVAWLPFFEVRGFGDLCPWTVSCSWLQLVCALDLVLCPQLSKDFAT